ncbi:hypothetical protein GJU41_11845 [Bacillus idriensis]|uniref:Uncharacterized protein n=1 Tax=Metabacillus idriensis TaxID=324768 RepID=A0A6I2M8M8_9BACI|nr:hypothetical protein [Metabacillus idriensis]MRX54665.1 hypothetical protein [Metabacillus idriensis]
MSDITPANLRILSNGLDERLTDIDYDIARYERKLIALKLERESVTESIENLRKLKEERQ